MCAFFESLFDEFITFEICIPRIKFLIMNNLLSGFVAWGSRGHDFDVCIVPFSIIFAASICSLNRIIILKLQIFQDSLVVIRFGIAILSKCTTEVFAHVEKHLYIEMVAFELPLGSSTETGFTRIGVGQRELFPHDDSAGRFLRLMYSKG